MTPTLVFLPGTLCDARVWQPVFDALQGRYACVLGDYGNCASMAAMAEHILARVPGPLIPIGLSMGGIVALEMQRRAPARVMAMALFGTNPGPDTEERFAGRARQMEFARTTGIGDMAANMLAPAYFATQDDHLQMLSDTVVAMARDGGLAAFASQSAALASRCDSWPLLNTITVPVLISHGRQDRICPPSWHEEMNNRIPNSRLEPIDDAGHLVPLERPEAVVHLLRDWLAGLGIRPVEALSPD